MAFPWSDRRKGARWPAVVCSTIVLSGVAPGAWAQAAPDGPRVVDEGIVIEDVVLVSPERPAPMPHAAVVLRDGRIARIGTGLVAGPNARRIDGRGRFLIPGLIDSHVHLAFMGPLDDGAIRSHPELLQAYRAHLPRAYLAFGFTTLVDLDFRPETLSWFHAAAVHPDLYHCGRGVRVAGGYGALQIPKDAASALNLVFDATGAQSWPEILDPRDYTPARAVDRVVGAGGTCVKAFVEPGFGGVFHWPVPSAEALDALRNETRRRGLVFVVHANAVESWRAALDAHADVIAHGLWHWPGDRRGTTPPREALDVIRAAASSGVGVQPTLQVVYGEESTFDRSLMDDPRLAEALPPEVMAHLRSDEGLASYRAVAEEYTQLIARIFGPGPVDAPAVLSIAPARAKATLRRMVDENVKLLFGSDTPTNEGFANPPGLNGRLELGRWFEAGVPLTRILRAATLDNAVAFQLSEDRGTIEVGKRADLLLLRADPLRTIAAYDAIETIFLDGTPLARGSLLPAR